MRSEGKCDGQRNAERKSDGRRGVFAGSADSFGGGGHFLVEVDNYLDLLSKERSWHARISLQRRSQPATIVVGIP